MTPVKCLLFLLLVIVVPCLIGSGFSAFLKEQKKSIGFMWISGCMTVWALFQVLCVYAIFRQGENGYHFLHKYFLAGVVALALLGGFIKSLSLFKGKKKKEESVARMALTKRKPGKGKILGYCLFAGLLLFQLVMALVYTYGDGDDAFYVAVSTLTESSKTLYKLMPYSMGNTSMDMRHSLAPFPVWIAMLSDYCEVRAVIVAHTMLPPVLIGITYTIYYKIGEVLFEKQREKIPYFLSAAALLVLFGDTSFYTVENFMLARSRQGKAALGSIIIPMLIYLCMLIFKRMQDGEKTGIVLYLILALTVTAACLCTTLGTFLSCMLLGILGLCGAVGYRKWECIWKTALSCTPAVIFALFYLLM